MQPCSDSVDDRPLGSWEESDENKVKPIALETPEQCCDKN